MDGLTGLNRKELEEVRVRCALLIQTKTTAYTSSLEDRDWILDGIILELRNRGLANETANFRIRNSKSFKGYQTKIEKVKGLLDKAGALEFTITEKMFLGEICAYELCNYLSHWNNLDLTLTSVLERVDYIPHALDKAYPGYLASNMLKLLMLRLYNSK